MNAPPGRQQGFTLLEVLAAAMIFFLVFAVTLQILSGSLRNTVRSADFSQAALWAQSKMDGLGIDPPIEEGLYEGEFDDNYAWEMEIQPYEVTDSETALSDDFPVDLYYVELVVLWDRDRRTPRRAVFRTLRSADPRQEPRGG